MAAGIRMAALSLNSVGRFEGPHGIHNPQVSQSQRRNSLRLGTVWPWLQGRGSHPEGEERGRERERDERERDERDEREMQESVTV